MYLLEVDGLLTDADLAALSHDRLAAVLLHLRSRPLAVTPLSLRRHAPSSPFFLPPLSSLYFNSYTSVFRALRPQYLGLLLLQPTDRISHCLLYQITRLL